MKISFCRLRPKEDYDAQRNVHFCLTLTAQCTRILSDKNNVTRHFCTLMGKKWRREGAGA